MNTVEQIFSPNNSASAQVNSKNDELGQEDFLKLLVAQLKNQDPSNPVENSEFLGQIAQFSMVSGIDSLGVSFDSVASSLFSTQAMQASQLVGKDILIETNTADLTEGESIEGVLESTTSASSVKIVIEDESGLLVQTLDLGNIGAGSTKFAWNGIDSEDTQAPSGAYTLRAEAFVDGSLQGVPIQIFSRVQSIAVDRYNTSVSLELSGNRSVGIGQVREFK
ncbi:MAG: flagellar hook capping protein [SAR86 cluster bacterium]|uniref:Basal-body rod modification protein FlgD n=1 Tax=SAR86 cluster bacterium TaxID=2030880 RepID=A0A2A4XH75_9GAMM|nr:MAG: flagellar hook capping protein [SAR86 cluster bacterium]